MIPSNKTVIIFRFLFYCGLIAMYAFSAKLMRNMLDFSMPRYEIADFLK